MQIWPLISKVSLSPVCSRRRSIGVQEAVSPSAGPLFSGAEGLIEVGAREIDSDFKT